MKYTDPLEQRSTEVSRAGEAQRSAVPSREMTNPSALVSKWNPEERFENVITRVRENEHSIQQSRRLVGQAAKAYAGPLRRVSGNFKQIGGVAQYREQFNAPYKAAQARKEPTSNCSRPVARNAIYRNRWAKQKLSTGTSNDVLSEERTGISPTLTTSNTVTPARTPLQPGPIEPSRKHSAHYFSK
ncbi:hypothetical protein MTO96_017500 [Rhipicephalus appendiculatus]